MQVQSAARCAVRPLTFAVALVFALTAAFAPAADAAPRAGTPAAGKQEHRVASTRQADWSGGPVMRWSGYSKIEGSRRVREVQHRLNGLGYRSGPVDGLFGPLTDRAVHRFQTRHRLRADGIVGSHTLRVLRTAGHHPASHSHPAPYSAPAYSHPALQPTGTPQAAQRPYHQWPELPVTPILVMLGALGLATAWRSYARTCAGVRRARSEALAATAGPAQPLSAVHDPPGRDRGRLVAGPIRGRDGGQPT